MARTDPPTTPHAPAPPPAAPVAPAEPEAATTAGSSEATLVQRHGRWLLIAVILAGVAALFWPRGGSHAAPGGFLVDGAGRPAPLAEHLAPVTLLHFYASWCPPCLEEAPALQRLTRDLATEPRFRVLLVAVQDDVAKAQSLAGTDQVLFDPGWETAHRYGTTQLPESYLLVEGKLLRKFDGPVDWDGAPNRAAIEQAIARVR